MDDLFRKMEQLLGVAPGQLTAESELRSLEEWDSLGTLSVVSLIDDDYGVTVLSEEIARVATAGELWALVQTKLASREEPA